MIVDGILSIQMIGWFPKIDSLGRMAYESREKLYRSHFIGNPYLMWHEVVKAKKETTNEGSSLIVVFSITIPCVGLFFSHFVFLFPKIVSLICYWGGIYALLIFMKIILGVNRFVLKGIHFLQTRRVTHLRCTVIIILYYDISILCVYMHCLEQN